MRLQETGNRCGGLRAGGRGRGSGFVWRAGGSAGWDVDEMEVLGAGLKATAAFEKFRELKTKEPTGWLALFQVRDQAGKAEAGSRHDETRTHKVVVLANSDLIDNWELPRSHWIPFQASNVGSLGLRFRFLPEPGGAAASRSSRSAISSAFSSALRRRRKSVRDRPNSHSKRAHGRLSAAVAGRHAFARLRLRQSNVS
jgi:hypothetical protein